MFIITRALDRSGLTRWIVRRLLEAAGGSERRLVGLFAATTAGLSLVMNNLAAGALILPGAMEAARRTGVKPSRLLIPIAYSSLLGGAATYFATANIAVSNLLMTANPPQLPLHVLAFTPTGGLIAVAGIAFLVLVGQRWLPDHNPAPEQMMARLTGSDMEDHYRLDERLWEARVLPESPLVNKPLSESEIGERYGVAVAGVLHRRQAILVPPPDQVIRSGDILLIVGREERVSGLTGVGLRIGRENSEAHISERGVSFVEVMPSPHSRALGRTLRELEFRGDYGLTALALFRGGKSHRTDVGSFRLMRGDSLLMVGRRTHLKKLRGNPDYIVLEPDLSDQPVNRAQAALTVGLFGAALAASVLGLPVCLAVLAAALMLILTGVLNMEEAYQAVEWQAIFAIAGMYSVSLAMINTGLARVMGEGLLSVVAPLGPLGLAAGAYALSAMLSQVMGGQVTALVTGPIAISAAISLGADVQAIAVATAVACSASFLTPIAHPVNILMIGPANYRFRDFARIGWRLTLVCFAALLVGLWLFWGLSLGG
jgi:di/tricarboxylate transporter